MTHHPFSTYCQAPFFNRMGLKPGYSIQLASGPASMDFRARVFRRLLDLGFTTEMMGKIWGIRKKAVMEAIRRHMLRRAEPVEKQRAAVA